MPELKSVDQCQIAYRRQKNKSDSYFQILPAAVTHLDAHPIGDLKVVGSTPAGSANSFMEV